MAMPWPASSIPAQRERFALLVLSHQQPFAHICSDFAISRKTGYKWLARYHAGGVGALADLPRDKPALASLAAAQWKLRVQAARGERPHWGGKKLRILLRRNHPREHLPSVRTIGRWLEQLKLSRLRPQRARRGPSVPHPGLTVPARLHQVWTVDFKGWYRTLDSQRQEPLTVREGKSCYVLAIVVLPNQSDAGVRGAMTDVFQREGLPTAIRVDNGAPFSGSGALGLSRLSVWWLRLGIRVEFTRRARPGDNAAHENMHKFYKAEVQSRPMADRHEAQTRSNEWRKDYNEERPHEGLGQRTPASCYAPSQRKVVAPMPALAYGASHTTHKVLKSGHITWEGRNRYVGVAFGGEQIGVKATSKTHHNVYLGKLLIGELHSSDRAGMRPARWKRKAATPIKV